LSLSARDSDLFFSVEEARLAVPFLAHGTLATLNDLISSATFVTRAVASAGFKRARTFLSSRESYALLSA
jgi:hypothetical protein